MCSAVAKMYNVTQQKITSLSHILLSNLFKILAISGFLLYVLYIVLSSHPCCRPYALFTNLRNNWTSSEITTTSHTNISHIVFGIAGNANSWKFRQPYLESWWKLNLTRGFIFLDTAPREKIPWPKSLPPFRVSENTSRYEEYNRHPMRHAIRMSRIILETFREVNKDVMWYVMADDDTIFFLDNLVEVLAKYDHRKYFYIGMNSESISSNFDHSFEMAFGGAGYALSYPLAEALANNLDVCIKNYPTLYGSDHIIQSCVADLGVSLSQERGFHQIDLHGDMSGLLSAHPHSLLISLHHLDAFEPIFPHMSRHESLKHLMKAAKHDQSRLFQQTICYDKQRNWSYSLSWGYTIQVYEKIYPSSTLQRPLETFIPWKRTAKPPYMFNTRPLLKNPCNVPHVFFFDSVENNGGSHIVTSYIRKLPRRLAACSSNNRGHSADSISNILVISPVTRYTGGAGSRRECCDIASYSENSMNKIQLRACMKDEIVA